MRMSGSGALALVQSGRTCICAAIAIARVGCTGTASQATLLKPLQLGHLSRQSHRQALLHVVSNNQLACNNSW